MALLTFTLTAGGCDSAKEVVKAPSAPSPQAPASASAPAPASEKTPDAPTDHPNNSPVSPSAPPVKPQIDKATRDDVYQTLKSYEDDLAKTILSGRPEYWKTFTLDPEGELYKQQAELIRNLVQQGVKEQFVKLSVDDLQPGARENEYIAYVTEHVEVKFPEKPAKIVDECYAYTLQVDPQHRYDQRYGTKISKMEPWNHTPVPLDHSQDTIYRNSKYGFTLNIPPAWNGKYIITDTEDGISVDHLAKHGDRNGRFFSLKFMSPKEWESFQYMELGERNRGMVNGKVEVFMPNHQVQYDPDRDLEDYNDFYDLYDDLWNVVTSLREIPPSKS